MAAAPGWLQAAEPAVRFAGTDIVPLGKTGIKVSRLAQGTGYNGVNHSSEHTRLGKAAFDRLLRHGMDEGIRFLDMADLYGSHPFVHDVIKRCPATSSPAEQDLAAEGPLGLALRRGKAGSRSLPQGARRRSPRCLLHCMTNDKWPTEFARIRGRTLRA